VHPELTATLVEDVEEEMDKDAELEEIKEEEKRNTPATRVNTTITEAAIMADVACRVRRNINLESVKIIRISIQISHSSICSPFPCT
jgi:hypothetical protein